MNDLEELVEEVRGLLHEAQDRINDAHNALDKLEAVIVPDDDPAGPITPEELEAAK